MKKITKLIMAACLLTGVAACDTDKDVVVYGEDSGAIQVEATINTAFTRSNPGATGEQQKQFNEGDELQLSCEDGYLNYVFSGGKWSPTDNYYLRWGTEPVTYSAFYPVINGASTANFILPTNQQRLENLANADYMTCTVENATDDGSRILRLGMNRKMAKVIMTLADVSGQGKVQGVKIGSYQGYTNGEVVETTSLVSPFITVPEGGKAGQNGCSYTAIVTPGKAGTTATFVSLNYLGEDLVMPGIPELKPGKCYEFTLKVEGSVISVSEPVVSPWDGGTLPGGDVEELQLAAYYVKEQPAGNATGMDWDNAMGVDALRNLLQTSSNSTVSNANAVKLDGKKIYVAAGSYEIAKENSGVKVEYSGYSKQVEITVEGGYDPSSTGTDLTRRDVSKYTTAFVRSTNSNASATSGGMFCLGNQINITFEDCTFDGQYKQGDKGDVNGFYVAAGQSGNAVLQLKNCVVKNFNRESASDAGPAIKIAKGNVFLECVEFVNNRAANRGGAILVGNNNAPLLFMNNCLLHGNHAPAAWGTAIHAGNGYVCMNNTTVLGTTGTSNSSVTVNGDARFMLSNTTIVGNSGNPNGVFRAGKGASLVVNSLFAKGAGTKTIYLGNITSKGYNVYQAADAGWGAIGTDTDYSSQTLPAASLTDGVYQWTVASIIDEFATRQSVIDAVKSFDATVGQQFVDWVGETGFGVDQRGATRNANKMQPGAYDAGL
ncbi:fimbrillin family protein [Bacteroides acidifaciens]|uniref:fimbrillin family protein n=1 Tax=Bacteroides acidifaciens TaxID=85831 RepID=UPI0015885B4A|nr:fimbrillin family protein [Bacteroides acidifaciens]